MKITKECIGKFKYVFEFDHDFQIILFCKKLKTLFGYKNFTFYRGKWRFLHLSVMDKILEEHPETAVVAALQPDIDLYEIEKRNDMLKEKKAYKLKQAVDTDFIVNNVRGKLYPYQKIGVEFLINSGGKAILADTMGLGKTLQSLAYVAHTKKDKILVICPASVKYSWESECLEWTNLKPFVISSKTDLDDNIINTHNIFIINYDIIKTFFRKLNELPWDSVICDEFHYIKNAKARRTMLTIGIAKKAPSILLLSGTPFLNKPIELFNGLQLMNPNKWTNWREYSKRYCDGQQGDYGWESNGLSNIEELKSEINKYFLRRNKDEVITELPPKRFIDLPIVLDREIEKKYNLAEKNLIKYLQDIKNKTKSEAKKSMKAEALVKLNEMRKLTSDGKIASAKETITNIVNSGEKVVVFSVYNEPLELLADYFKSSCVMIIGKTPSNKRGQIIDDFQNDKDKVIFLGGMKAAGAGITLTSASNVLFIDFSWVPADHWQAQDRIHRIGQKATSVSIYQLFAKNTIDERMKSIIKNKSVLFNKLIENKKEEEDDTNVMKKIIHSYIT